MMSINYILEATNLQNHIKDEPPYVYRQNQVIYNLLGSWIASHAKKELGLAFANYLHSQNVYLAYSAISNKI